MATPLLKVSAFACSRVLPCSFSLPAIGVQNILVRDASKKSGGVSKNKRGPSPGKRRGIKRHDGSFVHCGETLVTQLGLKLYPGENVGIRNDSTLYALCDGKVIVTCEELSPYPDSPLYEKVQNGVKIYKKFFNIYPTPLHAKFRLLSE